MSERLGRIISNDFTVRVSVDKLIDEHVNKATSLLRITSVDARHPGASLSEQ